MSLGAPQDARIPKHIPTANTRHRTGKTELNAATAFDLRTEDIIILPKDSTMGYSLAGFIQSLVK